MPSVETSINTNSDLDSITRKADLVEGDVCTCDGLDTERIHAGSKVNLCTSSFETGIADGFLVESDEILAGSSIASLVAFVDGKQHSYLKREIARLTVLLETVESRHGGEYPALTAIKNIFHQLCENLSPHIMKESIVLFPYLIDLENKVQMGIGRRKPHFGSVKNPIEMLLIEDNRIIDLMEKMKLAADDYRLPENPCPGMKELYRRLSGLERDMLVHIDLENRVLFPRAIELDADAERMNDQA